MQSPKVVLAVLFCQLCYSQVTLPFQTDDPAKCLTAEDHCDMSRSCTSLIIGSGCLKTPVPAPFIDPLKVACCFKCCSERHVYTDAIQRNATLMREVFDRTKLDVSSEHHASNMVASKSQLLRLARVVRTQSGNNIGSIDYIPSYDLSVVDVWDSQRWITIDAKRGLFANVAVTCLPASVYQQMFSRYSPTGSMIYGLYSNQLPCWPEGEVKRLVAARSEAVVSASAIGHTFSQRVEGAISRKESEQLPGPNNWRKELRLLPRGVRSTAAVSVALRDLREAPLPGSVSRLLLDCSCVKQYEWGRALLAEHPMIPCSSEPSFLDDVNGPGPVEDINEQHGAASRLVQYYKSLAAHSFVLAPSDPTHMSHCEWEALAMGAIPVVAHYMRLQSQVRELYDELPILFVSDLNDVTETYLQKKQAKLQEKFSDAFKYSLAKLFVPFWQGEFHRFSVQGKPPMRIWSGVGGRIAALRIADCDAVDQRAPAAARSMTNAHPVPHPVVQRDSTGRVSHRVNLPPRLARHSQSARSLGNAPSLESDLETYAETRSAHQHRHLQSAESGSSSQEDMVRRASRSDLRLEFVLPRCCEEGFTEFGWLREVLQATTAGKSSAASIYYKCAHCLPESKAKKWLSAPDTPLRNEDFSVVSSITAVDDASLLALGPDRVYQSPVIDRLHNGKEVTAYLTHIVQHYDHLAAQTVFLHTAPHAHLHLALFFRLVSWTQQCISNNNSTRRPVDFLHLNVHYKAQSGWATCCGCKIMGGPGSCRRGIWQHLFHDYPAMGPDYGEAHTYSSAQFTVSRDQILKWPKSFYEKMLHAIDGTIPSPGCCNSSTPDPWGGHHLTGQYERMWHMIFGQKRIQARRTVDHSLPQYLRLDCGHDTSCSVGALR